MIPRLAVTGLGAPAYRQVKQRIPEYARRKPVEQLCRTLQPKGLHLVGAERADADFGHPYGLVGYRPDLGDLLRPRGERPQVPVEREAMNSDRIDGLKAP
jgi:hypothetical protein